MLKVGSQVAATLNVAVTVVASVKLTWHVLKPEQPPPDQPVNTEPAGVDAVSVTSVPASKLVEHGTAQLMPAGLEVTFPVPAPANFTVSVSVVTASGRLVSPATSVPVSRTSASVSASASGLLESLSVSAR